MYIMLCGYPPYNGNTLQEVAARIKEGELEFQDEDWSHVSKQAKDLVTELLRYDYKERISAKDALKHPWFKAQIEAHEIDQKIQSKTLSSLSNFKNTSKLQEAT